jgi:hypothetical protein
MYPKITRRPFEVNRCGQRLAQSYPGQTEQNYRQNAWQVIDSQQVKTFGWTPLRLTRLYNDVARAAVKAGR